MFSNRFNGLLSNDGNLNRNCESRPRGMAISSNPLDPEIPTTGVMWRWIMKTGNVLTVSSLFVSIVVVVLHAQPPEVEWDMTYGGGRVLIAYSVQQTTDDGYIFAGVRAITYDDPGDVILVKTNSFGIRVWTRYYGGTSDEEARPAYLIRLA